MPLTDRKVWNMPKEFDQEANHCLVCIAEDRMLMIKQAKPGTLQFWCLFEFDLDPK